MGAGVADDEAAAAELRGTVRYLLAISSALASLESGLSSPGCAVAEAEAEAVDVAVAVTVVVAVALEAAGMVAAVGTRSG